MPVSTTRQEVGMEWSEAIESALIWMAAGGKSASTLRLRRCQLFAFARSVDCGPWEVRLADLLKFMANRQWSAETRKSYRASIRSFYRYAAAVGLIADDPSVLLPPVRVPPAQPRPAPESAVARALAFTDSPRDRLMILLARYLGLRRSEIATLHSTDLEGDVLYVKGKGAKVRRVPVPPELLVLLQQRPDGWVFSGQVDGHISPGHVGKILKRLLRDYHGHQLRHSFFSTAHGRGADLMTLTRLGGWSKPETAMVYTQTPDAALRDAVLAAGT